jgi:hypothetical protein
LNELIKILCGDKFTALHRFVTALCLTLMIPLLIDLKIDVAILMDRSNRPKLAGGITNAVIVGPQWPARVAGSFKGE